MIDGVKRKIYQNYDMHGRILSVSFHFIYAKPDSLKCFFSCPYKTTAATLFGTRGTILEQNSCICSSLFCFQQPTIYHVQSPSTIASSHPAFSFLSFSFSLSHWVFSCQFFSLTQCNNSFSHSHQVFKFEEAFQAIQRFISYVYKIMVF